MLRPAAATRKDYTDVALVIVSNAEKRPLAKSLNAHSVVFRISSEISIDAFSTWFSTCSLLMFSVLFILLDQCSYC